MAMKRNKDIDGGWAYVVGIGVFISFFIIAGFARSFGILYAAFIDIFGQTDSVTSLLVGVRSACAIISGPVGTILSERYTERKVVIAGALITSLGFALSFFATNLEFLIVTIGALQGIGTTIIIGPSMVCMGNYFVKKRSLALTVTSCGGCIGMMVVPILLHKLVEFYSVRGTLLIYGGLSLHLVIAGAVIRPLKADDGDESRDQELLYSNQGHQRPDSAENVDAVVECRSQHVERQKDAESLECEKLCTERNPDDFQTNEKRVNGSIDNEAERGIKERQILDRDIDTENLALTTTQSQNVAIEQERTECSRECQRRTFRRVFRRIVYFCTVLNNPLFLIILASSSLSAIPYVTMTMFLVPLLESRGISLDMAAILLSVMGGCDIVGRIVGGAIADKKPMEPKHVIFVASVLSGIFCSVLVFVSDFYAFLGLLIPYGLLASPSNILVMPATVKYVGLAVLPKAVGVIIFSYGITTAVSPSLLGLLRDKTGNYASIFPVLGSIHIISGLVFLLEPLARRHIRRNNQEPGS